MKINEKQLKEMVSSEIKNMISEIKYNTMYSLVNKCINEALDQDPRFNNTVENVVRECINNLKRNKINETVDSGVSDTHFAILKPINKIIFSWDYSGYDNAELREFKKYYFMDDIVDMGFNPKEVKILTKAACLRQGINPEDETCWDNAYEYKVESVSKRNTLKEEYNDDQNHEDHQPMEAIDFYDFENICHSNGWDWHSSFEVNNGKQTGVRYIFAQGKGCSFEELIAQIKQKANDPNGIITGTATNKNAPEIKYYTIIVLFV